MDGINDKSQFHPLYLNHQEIKWLFNYYPLMILAIDVHLYYGVELEGKVLWTDIGFVRKKPVDKAARCFSIVVATAA
ncbi:hypothetical protein [Nostoc sp.]|uniref:hypothetical protein n=1 Tax=Nostoc sp. TaxID=1180 RepID=UPI002FFCCD41